MYNIFYILHGNNTKERFEKKLINIYKNNNNILHKIYDRMRADK